MAGLHGAHAARSVLLVAGLLLVTAPAGLAASSGIASPAGEGTTILHLGASATVMVTPDEIATELSTPGTGANPEAAQAEVNALMSEALAIAHGATAVTASTGSYAVWHVSEPKEEWRASQTLSLTSKDGPALLALVGALQAKGLAVSNLVWRLSPATARAAREKAEIEALSKLRGRAEAAATVLGLRFEAFREVWLAPSARPPIEPMMAAARAMPAPQAVAAEAAVTASVTADVALGAPTRP